MFISRQRIVVTALIVVATAFVLVSNLGASEAELKPLKAWVQETNAIPMTIGDAQSSDFLSEVMADRGMPDLMQVMTLEGTNNVGGRVIVQNAQIFYLYPSGDADLFEDGTITVANGDRLYITIEAMVNLLEGLGIGTINVVGGTGRFEGTEGAATFTVAINSDGKAVVSVEGYIMTVGQTRE